jgi:hypothetical protein
MVHYFVFLVVGFGKLFNLTPLVVLHNLNQSLHISYQLCFLVCNLFVLDPFLLKSTYKRIYSVLVDFEHLGLDLLSFSQILDVVIETFDFVHSTLLVE